MAIWAAKRARGRPFRVMVILVLVTAAASAVLDNVTTVLLIAPVTFLVCERLAVPVAPFLIAEALASNIGGTATLVGDPPNIIIASRAGLSYNDFLVHLAPLVLLLLVVFIGLCRWLFRAAFTYDGERAAAVMALRRTRRHPRPAAADRQPGRARRGHRGVRAAQPAAPGPLGRGPGRRPGAARRSPGWTPNRSPGTSSGPPWCSSPGCSSWSAPWSTPASSTSSPTRPPSATEGRLLLAALGLLWGLGRRCPASWTTSPTWPTMSPVVADTRPRTRATPASPRCCGGRSRSAPTSAATPPPSAPPPTSWSWASPNAPVDRISFWEFTKYGLIVAAVTVGIATPYLWLRYFVLAG